MSPPEVHATFAAEPASASAARRLIDRTLRDWSCDHLTAVASLLLSELVANAVLHAGTTIDVTIRVDYGRLRIEVRDGNTRLPSRKHYSRLSATGRGLLLVERMADDWGVEGTPEGKIVWFELGERSAGGEASFGLIDVDPLDVDLEELAPRKATATLEDERRGSADDGRPRMLTGTRR